MEYHLGQIVFIGGTYRPTDYDANGAWGLLPCDGSWYPAAAYPSLVTWGRDRLVFNGDYTQFSTPDLRAYQATFFDGPYGNRPEVTRLYLVTVSTPNYVYPGY
jgi:hypothetical protein